jgi:hypothetical protein
MPIVYQLLLFICIGKEMETTSIVPRKAFKSRTGWSFLSSGKIYLRLENFTQSKYTAFRHLITFRFRLSKC